MHKVIRSFVDLHDNGYRYQVGEVYPRQGAKSENARVEELSTNKNKMGAPLIEEVPEEATRGISEALEDSSTGERPVEQPEVKKKPRKSEKK